MKTYPTEERNRTIYECWKRGDSLATIADKYGISRERARQIVRDQMYKNPIEKTWLSQFDNRTRVALIRNGITNEAELHEVYNEKGKINGIRKKTLKEISSKLTEPLPFRKAGGQCRVDHTGERFGRLTVIGRSPKKGYWLCKCDCGNETSVQYGNLKDGRTKSCGCVRNEYYASLHKRRMLNVIRCTECRYNSNVEGNYVNCVLIPQMFGKTPDNNYCSYAERKENKSCRD